MTLSLTLINHIQLEYSGADISLCSLGNYVSGFKKDITIRDVIGTYIYPNTIVVKKLSGHILKQALEKTAEFFEIIDDEINISPDFNTPYLSIVDENNPNSEGKCPHCHINNGDKRADIRLGVLCFIPKYPMYGKTTQRNSCILSR